MCAEARPFPCAAREYGFIGKIVVAIQHMAEKRSVSAVVIPVSKLDIGRNLVYDFLGHSALSDAV